MSSTIDKRRLICIQFFKGEHTVPELSKKFGLSVNGVKLILNQHLGTQGRYVQRPQSSLFHLRSILPGKEKWVELKLPTRSKYQISNFGKIRSFAIDRVNGRLLKFKLLNGYLAFDFFNYKKQLKQTKLVHTLVAEHFLTKPKTRKPLYLIHSNHDKYDNSAKNLKWVERAELQLQITQSPRLKQYHKIFKKMSKEKIISLRTYKLKSEDVKEIKKEIFIHKHKNFNVKELAAKFNISQMQIARIARGDSWSYVLPKLSRDKQVTRVTPAAKVNKIVKALQKGSFNQKQIAQNYGVTETLVSRIKSRYLL